MRIKELRQKNGLYQSQLADAVGVSTSAVCKWETGAALPSIEKLPALAAALHCTIDALYGREPPEGEERKGA